MKKIMTLLLVLLWVTSSWSIETYTLNADEASDTLIIPLHCYDSDVITLLMTDEIDSLVIEFYHIGTDHLADLCSIYVDDVLTGSSDSTKVSVRAFDASLGTDSAGFYAWFAYASVAGVHTAAGNGNYYVKNDTGYGSVNALTLADTSTCHGTSDTSGLARSTEIAALNDFDGNLNLDNVTGDYEAGDFGASSLDDKGNWNIGKTGYALTTADWNVGKTGYSLTTADWNVGKTGYSLTTPADYKADVSALALEASLFDGNLNLTNTTGDLDSSKFTQAFYAAIQDSMALHASTYHSDGDTLQRNVINGDSTIGVDWGNVANPTTTVGLSGTTIKASTDTETDIANLNDFDGSLTGTQTFNMTGSITGNLSGSVGTVTDLADSAIDEASIKGNSIDSSKLAEFCIGKAEIDTTARNEIEDAVYANRADYRASGFATVATAAEIKGYIDTEIATLIDYTDGDDSDGIDAKIAAITDYVDTEIADIKTVTDKLMFEGNDSLIVDLSESAGGGGGLALTDWIDYSDYSEDFANDSAMVGVVLYLAGDSTTYFYNDTDSLYTKGGFVDTVLTGTAATVDYSQITDSTRVVLGESLAVTRDVNVVQVSDDPYAAENLEAFWDSSGDDASAGENLADFWKTGDEFANITKGYNGDGYAGGTIKYDVNVVSAGTDAYDGTDFDSTYRDSITSWTGGGSNWSDGQRDSLLYLASDSVLHYKVWHDSTAKVIDGDTYEQDVNVASMNGDVIVSGSIKTGALTSTAFDATYYHETGVGVWDINADSSRYTDASNKIGKYVNTIHENVDGDGTGGIDADIATNNTILSGTMDVNIIHISGTATAADGLEAMFDGTGGVTLTLEKFYVNNTVENDTAFYIKGLGANGVGMAILGTTDGVVYVGNSGTDFNLTDYTDFQGEAASVDSGMLHRTAIYALRGDYHFNDTINETHTHAYFDGISSDWWGDSISATGGLDAGDYTWMEAEFDALSLSGGGTEPETLVICYDISSPAPIEGAKITIRNITQSTLKVDGLNTDVNGVRILELDSDSFFVAITHNNYDQLLDTLIVDVGGDTDTLWMTEFDPGSATDTTKCKVYGWIKNPDTTPIDKVSVSAVIPQEYWPVRIDATDTAILARLDTKTDSLGYWELELPPTSILNDTTSYWLISANKSGTNIFTIQAIVPDTVNVQDGDLETR